MGKIRIKRKAYSYTRNGKTVKVPATSYSVVDRGNKGKTSYGAKGGTHSRKKGFKPLIQREGKLGGPGFTTKASRTRHGLINKAVDKYGYRSTMGSLTVLLRNSGMSEKKRKAVRADIAWMKKNHGGKKK